MRSTGTARFDLACEINEEGDGLEVAWLFRRNLFPLADIQNLGRLYLAALAGVCRSPEIADLHPHERIVNDRSNNRHALR